MNPAHMLKWLICIAFLLIGVARADALDPVHERISAWQTAQARRALEPLLKDDPNDVGVRFALGRLLFNESRYAESAEVMEALVAELGAEAPEPVREQAALSRETRDALKGFDEHLSPDGRFLIRTQGVDKLLVPFLLEVLTAQDKALAADFGPVAEERVVVEIYPSADYLAKVSPLTDKDIETSGTIALCKYNRLMFTSPRALVRGYGWRDTVAHEFVHYYISKVSGETVPIWLHEGLAKFFETRWRGHYQQAMEPPQEDLLARSVQADKLVTFEQMHPSMAKLPSQEAASLAYAEVHTVIRMLFQERGLAGLTGLLARLTRGEALNVALRGVYGVDLSGLWTKWRRAIPAMGLKTYPGLLQTSLKFKRPGASDSEEPEADYDTIEEKKVKDFAHLGELLRARGRDKAALVEYRKAMALGGDGHPVVQNGAAAVLLELGRPAEVVPLLERVALYYPTFVTTHLHLGAAFVALGKTSEAIAAFEEAVGINPFHPGPHEALARLYAQAGRAEEAARARAALEMLR